MKKLMEQTEKFIKNMRWKAFFFLNPNAKKEDKEVYGFKTWRAPPAIEELKTFEDKMRQMITDIKFKKSDNAFQTSLRNEIKTIQNDNKILTKADKTSNFYKMEPREYSKLLDRNIQKNYKKTNKATYDQIRKNEKELVQQLDLSDRIEITAEREAFITLKDHKPNFPNNPTCRLINPSKSELGKISKKILEKTIKNIRENTKLNLWKNTYDVIQWFRNLRKQDSTVFITFDVVDFYPSIDEELLTKAIKFANKHTEISGFEMEIIFHTKKTLLHNKNENWIKNTRKSSTFDVTMGSYDGAETCELVGLFMLSIIQRKLGKQIGLYRDDGLAALSNTPRNIENKKKELCKIFNDQNLKVTIEANKKVVNYLDITLDLNSNIFKPYKKPNDTPVYVNIKSNHPPSILKTIPRGINKRLSNLSCNETVFNNTTAEYQEALNQSGYNYKLHYDPGNDTTRHKKHRKRKIIWYNPPYDGRVKTM